MALSGCFVIPLVDGRSPFDDPFGASNGDIERALPAIDDALAAIDPGADWQIDTYKGSENCEGECGLHVTVRISPTGAASSSSVPASLLQEVLEAAVPAAEEERVDVEVNGGSVEYGADDAEILAAAEQLFGRIPESGIRNDSYSVELGYRGNDAEIMAYTRDNSDVLADMGLG